MKNNLLWALFVVLALAFGFCALVFAVGAVSAFSPHQGTTTGQLIAGDAVFAVLAVVLGWLARSVEHHARTNEGFRASVSKGLAWRAPQTARRHSFHSRRVEMVWLGVVTVVLVVLAVAGVSSWQRSHETQAHGLRATGVVTSLVVVNHSSRYSSYDTYNLVVKLTPPVRGRQSTVVNTNYESPPASVGQRVEVLVDPNDLGYAELPDAPVATISNTIAPLAFVVVIGGALAWSLARRRRAPRFRAQYDPVMATPKSNPR